MFTNEISLNDRDLEGGGVKGVSPGCFLLLYQIVSVKIIELRPM